MKMILAVLALFFAVAACNHSGDADKDTINMVTETEEQQLKKEIAAHPDSLQLHDRLLNIYFKEEKYEAAIAVANQALAVDSNNAHFWDAKGEMYAYNDDTANAIRALERAAELNPLPETMLTLGYFYADTKNEKALVIGDALIIADKANAQKEALLIKGIYYSKTGSPAKAIALFDEALQLDYTFMFAYREKGMTLYNMGKYAGAIQVLDKGTKLQNSFTEGYYWMGRCYEKLGNTAEAIEKYKAAVLYTPAGEEYTEAVDALGRLGVK
jgi:tetratricopeptide (TPR) repeat protein